MKKQRLRAIALLRPLWRVCLFIFYEYELRCTGVHCTSCFAFVCLAVWLGVFSTEAKNDTKHKTESLLTNSLCS
jgi:hypothetical protein